LSRKAVLEDNKNGGPKKRPEKRAAAAEAPPTVMSTDEIDVIAQAIEGLSD
jgi:hypothetical protein